MKSCPCGVVCLDESVHPEAIAFLCERVGCGACVGLVVFLVSENAMFNTGCVFAGRRLSVDSMVNPYVRHPLLKMSQGKQPLK